jgi:Cu/Ag efflux protein CusF
MNVMKRLFAFFLILFVASLGQAAITAHQPAFSAEDKTVSGEVASVDADKKEVVIKDSAGAEVRLVVNDSTKLTKGDETVSLADLKPGVKVTCEAAESEGKLVAKSIQVAKE